MSTVHPIHAVLLGAGPLGVNIYRHALKRQDILITQVVDIDTSLKGRDMGEYSGLDASGILITNSLDNNRMADVAILATVSDLPRIGPQILALIDAGLSVVSTCEELFYSWESSREWSEKIDKAAREKGVAILGTGVNPGFHRPEDLFSTPPWSRKSWKTPRRSAVGSSAGPPEGRERMAGRHHPGAAGRQGDGTDHRRSATGRSGADAEPHRARDQGRRPGPRREGRAGSASAGQAGVPAAGAGAGRAFRGAVAAA